jgi:hypothetical protein
MKGIVELLVVVVVAVLTAGLLLVSVAKVPVPPRVSAATTSNKSAWPCTYHDISGRFPPATLPHPTYLPSVGSSDRRHRALHGGG